MTKTPPPDPAKPTKQAVARRRNAAVRRERILAEGGRSLYLLLQRDAADALEAIEAAGHTATGAISALLIEAARTGRMLEKPAE